MSDYKSDTGRYITRPKVYNLKGSYAENEAIKENLKEVLKLSYESLIYCSIFDYIFDCNDVHETVQSLVEDFEESYFPHSSVGDDPEMSANISYVSNLYSDALLSFINVNNEFNGITKDSLRGIKLHDLKHSVSEDSGVISVYVADDLRTVSIAFEFPKVLNTFLFTDQYFVSKIHEMLEDLKVPDNIFNKLKISCLEISGTVIPDGCSYRIDNAALFRNIGREISVGRGKALKLGEVNRIETTLSDYQKWILDGIVEQNVEIPTYILLTVKCTSPALILIME